MHYAWWEIALFVVGLLSFISIIVVLFLPVGNGRSTFTYTGVLPSVGSAAFVPTLSQSLNLPIRQGEHVEAIDTGDAFLQSLLTDIDAAHTSIDIMTYIWTDGRMSDAVFEHLDKKLSEGVSVRIIIDGFGSTGRPTKKFEAFEKAGGKYAIFRSLTIAPWDLLKNRARNHRRAFIIDNEIGYTGGMTISDPWLGKARNPDEYRDIMFRVQGSMAHDLQGAFGELWTSMTGEILAGTPFFSGESTDVHGGKNTYIPLQSTPSPDSMTLQRLILQSIGGAKKSVYMTTPYFLPDESLRKALEDKAKAGVDVRILVPDEHSDIASVRYASRYSYEELLSAGVRIYEYQVTFIHTKILVIDGDWSIIGSANMDFRSRNINEEFVFGVSDPELASTLRQTFSSDLEHATEIALDTWRERSLWERWREVFALKFVQQY